MKKKGAGRYSKRVTFQRLKTDSVVNAAGHIDETSTENWESYCSRWAAVSYARGSEISIGDQQSGRRNPIFRVRHDSITSDLTTSMRLIMDRRTFSISEPPIVIDEDNREVEFIAVEIA